eukprot:1146613-Pelagomonas_calceolata.AAC.6
MRVKRQVFVLQTQATKLPAINQYCRKEGHASRLALHRSTTCHINPETLKSGCKDLKEWQHCTYSQPSHPVIQIPAAARSTEVWRKLSSLALVVQRTHLGPNEQEMLLAEVQVTSTHCMHCSCAET